MFWKYVDAIDVYVRLVPGTPHLQLFTRIRQLVLSWYLG